MGQKINPISLRLGIVRGWDSNWYGGKSFSEKLVEDQKIREYVQARIPKGGIAKVVIERTLKRITLTIHTARPGVVIGKGGNEVDKIKEELKKLTGKDVQINIFEIKRPELDSKLVGESIAQQIEARISYKRAMKQAIASAMRVGAEGIKVKVSGRLAGADMARQEQYKEGRIPLHTLRAGKRDLSPNVGMMSNQQQGGGSGNQGGERRGGDDRRGGGRGGDRRRGGEGGGDRRRGGNDGGGRRRNG
jgi:small subunit ribosomal protein S3